MRGHPRAPPPPSTRPSSNARLRCAAPHACAECTSLALPDGARRPPHATRFASALLRCPCKRHRCRGVQGTLEEEGADNPWMSECGWADYLDKNAQSSYNMNQRPSKADDGYWTPGTSRPAAARMWHRTPLSGRPHAAPRVRCRHLLQPSRCAQRVGARPRRPGLGSTGRILHDDHER